LTLLHSFALCKVAADASKLTKIPSFPGVSNCLYTQLEYVSVWRANDTHL
jgi:hypothetical protein